MSSKIETRIPMPPDTVFASVNAGLGRIWIHHLVPVARAAWKRYGRMFLIAATAYMALTAFLRLRYAFTMLAWRSGGALDLRFRFIEVQAWFEGSSVYESIAQADYPPASYAMLWPLLGPLPLDAARWLWMAVVLLSLVLLAYVAVRESSAGMGSERAFAALLIFPMYCTQMTVWIGQLGIFVLVLLIVGLLLLRRGEESWWKDGLMSVLLVLALVKPSLSVPFFWIVLFRPGRWRPIVLVGLLYILLTSWAAAFQEGDIFALLHDWLTGRTSELSVEAGHANLHKWLALAGLERFSLPASLVVLLVFGIWIYGHRRGDFWILLGISALVARVWFHHGPHDDVLVFISMIALLRIAKRGPQLDSSDVAAAIFFAAAWLMTLLPFSAFHFIGTPAPWIVVLVEMVQSTVWLTTLVFLMYIAGRKSV